jgi:DNA-directed RNA polymerase specialized sigma24 family protein
MATRPADEGSAFGALEQALASLDSGARLVLALLFVEGLTVEETALALGLEVSQVDRVASFARDRLAARVAARPMDRPEGRAA